MAIPAVDQLRQPALDALHAQDGIASISAITDHVLSALQLPADEAGERDPRHNAIKVGYRLASARTYFKKSGLPRTSSVGVGADREREDNFTDRCQ